MYGTRNLRDRWSLVVTRVPGAPEGPFPCLDFIHSLVSGGRRRSGSNVGGCLRMSLFADRQSFAFRQTSALGALERRSHAVVAAKSKHTLRTGRPGSAVGLYVPLQLTRTD